MNEIKAKRAVIIGIDGAGGFVREANTPHLDGLLARGAYTYEAQTVYPSISAQCWGSLLYGVSPERHGLDNDMASQGRIPADYPHVSLFGWVRRHAPHAKLASFCCWSPINTGILEDSSLAHTVSVPDGQLALEAVRYIRENPDFTLLFFVLDEVDSAGHRHGWKSEGYFRALSEADARAGQVLEALADMNLLEDTLIVAVSDHGGGGERADDHGSAHPDDMNIFWCAQGPRIVSGKLTGPVSIMDIPVVAVRALGLPVPSFWEGRVPEGLFTDEGRRNAADET